MDIKQKRAMRAQQRREAKKLTGKRWKKLMATESVAGTSVTGLSIKLGPPRERITVTSNGKAPTADEFFDAMRLLSQRVCGGMD